MTKNILVIYYTQSGQLKDILDSILLPIEKTGKVIVEYEQIKPVSEYPFPWGGKFFDCFPESVKGIPCKLESFSFAKEKNYDLILIAYQPWYMSPSIPVWSFLESEEAARLLQGKNIISIIGARNMWISSYEIVTKKLSELKAKLAGNIVLTDKSCNYISAINIVRWLIKGEKKPTLLLPEAGVSQKDIINASVFGKTINETLRNEDWENLQNSLLKVKAVKVKYHLFKIEQNARKIFDKFAGYILKKGSVGDQRRNKRLLLFKIYLIFVLFVISPVASLVFVIHGVLFLRKTKEKILYYSGINIK